MIPTTLNIGSAPNDGTGDPIRTIFQAINANFATAFAAAPKCNFDAPRAPLSTDDYTAGYEAGSLWLVPARGTMWRCANGTPGAAVWLPFGTMDHPGYRTDGFYAAPMSASAAANIAANTLYAHPFALLFRRRIKGLYVYAPTGTAGNCKLGIYAHDPETKLPGSLIAEVSADTAMPNTSAAGAVFSDMPDLPPNLYWLASCWSTVCAPYQVPATLMAGGMAWMWGADSAEGVLTGTASSIPTRYTRTAALPYQAGVPFFPASFGAGTFGNDAPGSPLISWRCE